MSNEFVKQRVNADRELLAQNLSTMRGQLADLEAQANKLRDSIAQRSGALQYADVLLQQINAQEEREKAEENKRQQEQAKKAAAENMAEVSAELAHEPDYGAPRYDT